MSETASSARLPILPTPGLTHPRFSRLRFMAAAEGGDGTPGAGGDGGGDGEGGKEFKAPANQAEFDAMVKDRIARVQAKFADYDALKAKAQQFDAAQVTTADRIAKLEQELESTRTTALRSRVQAKFGISDEDADLFLTATDEASLTKQAERLAEHTSDRKKNGNRDPFAGRTPNGSGSDPMREFARGLFSRDD